MNREKLMSKIITAVVAGGVLLSTGSLVFAKSTANATNGSTTKSQHFKMNKANSTENTKAALDALVTAGTITESQETKVIDYITTQKTERQAEMEKVKTMTEAERKTYFESKSTEKTAFLNELVTAGTLTEAQATTIRDAIHQGHGGKNHEQNSERIRTQLGALVTAGTITQDEETNISNYLTQKQADRETEMEKIKNMTETERKTYFESNKKEKTDFMSELVTAGIISQDKADAIKAAMPNSNDHGFGREKITK